MFLGIPSPKCMELHLRYLEQARFSQQLGLRFKIAAFRFSGTSASSLCILSRQNMPKANRTNETITDAEKNCIDLVAQNTDKDATTLFFTDKEEFNRLLRAALGVVPRSEEDFKTWPAMWQRMAFYAKVWNPKTGFTLKGPEIAEYKALIEKGIALEQARIEQGGLPQALTLNYLREICMSSEHSSR